MYCRLFLLTLTMTLLAGCRSAMQTVDISSSPPGAAVQIDGQSVGMTPFQVDLKTVRSHSVAFEKDGYKSTKTLLVAKDKTDAPYVQFGLKVDAGHYRELIPSPLHVELVSDLVPDSVGSDRFAELSKRIAELDALLASGTITAPEHARILEQILAVYQ